MGSYILDNKQDLEDLQEHLENCKGDDDTVVTTLRKETMQNLVNLMDIMYTQSDEALNKLMEKHENTNGEYSEEDKKTIIFHFDMMDIMNSLSFGEDRCQCCGDPIVPNNTTIH